MSTTGQKAVAVVDLAHFSDASRALQNQLGSVAVAELQRQIMGFIEGALDDIGLKLDQIPHKGTGDGAILALDQADYASRFAKALHRRTKAWNQDHTETRNFRVGIALGELTIEDSNGWNLAGDVISHAVRLEQGCGNDEILITTEAWRTLSEKEMASYGEFVTKVSGKRAEVFEVHRWPARSPYKGLKSFDEPDQGLYFGREKETQDLVDLLQAGKRLIALVGASGAGKSSLLGAGLTPRLRADNWRIVRMRPGDQPFRELEKSLASVEVSVQAEELIEAPELLHSLIDAGERPTALIIDQFEELFTLTSPEHRASFLNALLTTIRKSRNLCSVLALRADFLDAPLREAGDLPSFLAESHYMLTPMKTEQIRRAVRGPAEAVGLNLEEGLAGALTDAVEREPGNLPLLQFTLDLLFRHRDGQQLTWAAYKDIGKLRGAIGRHADAVFRKLTDEDQQQVRRIFGRLVRLDEGLADTRRWASRKELDALGRSALVDHLVDERLLTAQEEYLEIAHEALIREWQTLRDWIEDNREALSVQEAVARAASEWHRREGDLWPGGDRLDNAVALEAGQCLTLTEQENRFLAESTRIAKRTNLLKRSALWTIAVLLAGSLGAFSWALAKQREALINERQTVDARKQAVDAREKEQRAEETLHSTERMKQKLQLEVKRLRRIIEADDTKTALLDTRSKLISTNRELRDVLITFGNSLEAAGAYDAARRRWSHASGIADQIVSERADAEACPPKEKKEKRAADEDCKSRIEEIEKEERKAEITASIAELPPVNGVRRTHRHSRGDIE